MSIPLAPWTAGEEIIGYEFIQSILEGWLTLYPIEPSLLGINGCLFILFDDIPGIGNRFGLERPRRSLRCGQHRKITERTTTYPGVPGMCLNFPPRAAIAEGPQTGC
jgi:hypothetical protein